jgi:hypothetical protein
VFDRKLNVRITVSAGVSQSSPIRDTNIVVTVDQNFDSMEGIVNTDYHNSNHGSQSTLVSTIPTVSETLGAEGQ